MLKLKQIKNTNENSLSSFKEIASTLLKEYFSNIVSKTNIENMLYFLEEEPFKAELKYKKYDYYFISHNDNNIGFLSINIKDNMLNISRIFLNKDKRNQGYGRKIINLIKKEASKRNLKKLRICIPVDKEETSLIFTKLGFKKSRETAWYLGDDVFLYSYIYISDL